MLGWSSLINRSSVGFKFVFSQIVFEVAGNFRCGKGNVSKDGTHLAGIQGKFFVAAAGKHRENQLPGGPGSECGMVAVMSPRGIQVNVI